jgi:hypothetical protein
MSRRPSGRTSTIVVATLFCLAVNLLCVTGPMRWRTRRGTVVGERSLIVALVRGGTRQVLEALPGHDVQGEAEAIGGGVQPLVQDLHARGARPPMRP